MEYNKESESINYSDNELSRKELANLYFEIKNAGLSFDQNIDIVKMAVEEEKRDEIDMIEREKDKSLKKELNNLDKLSMEGLAFFKTLSGKAEEIAKDYRNIDILLGINKLGELKDSIEKLKRNYFVLYKNIQTFVTLLSSTADSDSLQKLLDDYVTTNLNEKILQTRILSFKTEITIYQFLCLKTNEDIEQLIASMKENKTEIDSEKQKDMDYQLSKINNSFKKLEEIDKIDTGKTFTEKRKELYTLEGNIRNILKTIEIIIILLEKRDNIKNEQVDIPFADFA